MSPDKFYRHYVGFPVTDGAGISAVSKPNGGAVRFANNFGLAKYPYPCMLCEGQSFSAFMNELPLINSIAGIHDVMNQGLSDGVFAITNVPTMFIAAGMTYQAWTFAKAREAINYITKPFCSSHQLSC